MVGATTETIRELTEMVTKSAAMVGGLTETVGESTEMVGESTEMVGESTEMAVETTEATFLAKFYSFKEKCRKEGFWVAEKNTPISELVNPLSALAQMVVDSGGLNFNLLKTNDH